MSINNNDEIINKSIISSSSVHRNFIDDYQLNQEEEKTQENIKKNENKKQTHKDTEKQVRKVVKQKLSTKVID